MPHECIAALLVRPAVAGDATALAAVFAAAINGRALGAYGPNELAAWVAQGSVERFAIMLADPDKTLLAAEAAGRIVGLAGIEGSEIALLYAAPHAPAGTGTALLAAVEALARGRGNEAVSLVASRNAVPFYLKRGYDILGLATRSLPGGFTLPVCLMGKDLSLHDSSIDAVS